MQQLAGVIVVNKPRGVISKDVSRILERRFGKLKLGHVGTLDPSAHGVLPLLLGKATKIQDTLLELPKTYEFSVKFGSETDTLDLDGEVVRSGGRELFIFDEINGFVSKYLGRITQIPPLYSAIKLNGRPLYEYARKGIDVSAQIDEMKRSIHIDDYRLLSVDGAVATFTVTCSKGTYVRCLARDLAADLGTYATVTEICRTAAAGFTLADAVEWDMIQNADQLELLVKPLATLRFATMPMFQLQGRDQGILLRHGQKVLVPRAQFVRSEATRSGALNIDNREVLYLLDESGVPLGFGASHLINDESVELILRKGF